jgi:hypothetical protein
MSVSCECCVFSGRGLAYELIAHPEESYRLWCVVGSRNLVNEEALAHSGTLRQNNKSMKLIRADRTRILMTPCG